MSGGPRLTVVVPTRNRASFAVAAVRSVLDQGAGARLLVSDNSTRPDERADLERACRELGPVDYVRPPEPLGMSAHWEWAMDAALARTSPTHALYLTDRMVLRPGSLATLLGHIARHPDRVVSYNLDHVDDLGRPVRLFQKRGTGRLFRIPSRTLLERAARSVPLVALPRMLNCAAPVAVMDAVRNRFGSLFLSISPDFCFAFRCAAVVDEILYWDASALIQYGFGRSNGTSARRGVITSDSADFMQNLGSAVLNEAAPVPAFRTVGNGVVHEYARVREQVGGDALPEVDRALYLAAIADEVKEMEAGETRAEMERLLAREGPVRVVGSRLLVLRRLKRWAAVLSPSFSQPLWLALGRRFGISPPGENALEFASVEEALAHARRFPRRPRRRATHLRFLAGRLERADEA